MAAWDDAWLSPAASELGADESLFSAVPQPEIKPDSIAKTNNALIFLFIQNPPFFSFGFVAFILSFTCFYVNLGFMDS